MAGLEDPPDPAAPASHQWTDAAILLAVVVLTASQFAATWTHRAALYPCSGLCEAMALTLGWLTAGWNAAMNALGPLMIVTAPGIPAMVFLAWSRRGHGLTKPAWPVPELVATVLLGALQIPWFCTQRIPESIRARYLPSTAPPAWLAHMAIVNAGIATALILLSIWRAGHATPRRRILLRFLLCLWLGTYAFPLRGAFP